MESTISPPNCEIRALEIRLLRDISIARKDVCVSFKQLEACKNSNRKTMSCSSLYHPRDKADEDKERKLYIFRKAQHRLHVLLSDFDILMDLRQRQTDGYSSPVPCQVQYRIPQNFEEDDTLILNWIQLAAFESRIRHLESMEEPKLHIANGETIGTSNYKCYVIWNGGCRRLSVFYCGGILFLRADNVYGLLDPMAKALNSHGQIIQWNAPIGQLFEFGSFSVKVSKNETQPVLMFDVDGSSWMEVYKDVSRLIRVVVSEMNTHPLNWLMYDAAHGDSVKLVTDVLPGCQRGQEYDQFLAEHTTPMLDRLLMSIRDNATIKLMDALSMMTVRMMTAVQRSNDLETFPLVDITSPPFTHGTITCVLRQLYHTMHLFSLQKDVYGRCQCYVGDVNKYYGTIIIFAAMVIYVERITRKFSVQGDSFYPLICLVSMLANKMTSEHTQYFDVAHFGAEVGITDWRLRKNDGTEKETTLIECEKMLLFSWLTDWTLPAHEIADVFFG